MSTHLRLRSQSWAWVSDPGCGTREAGFDADRRPIFLFRLRKASNSEVLHWIQFCLLQTPRDRTGTLDPEGMAGIDNDQETQGDHIKID